MSTPVLEPSRVQPFEIRIPKPALDDVRARLERVRWPPELGNDDWSYGTNRAYLESLRDHWLHQYSWSAQQDKMNSFRHFTADVDGQRIHFLREPGSGRRPLPLIMTHGWPWTFWDFQKVILPLAHPERFGGDEADAFEVIVPSLPGYGFSTPLARTGVNYVTTADLWMRLMRDILGFDRFAAHGADWGLIVTEQMGHKYAEHLVGIHLQMAVPLDFHSGGGPKAEDFGPGEEDWPARNARFIGTGSGYSALQSTRPQTIGYALHDSLIGLAAWLVEKRRAWSDSRGEVESRFSKDDLITNTMLYWLTESYVSSARFYAEAVRTPWSPSHTGAPVVAAPTAVMMFVNDLVGMPRRWAERYFNLQRWNTFPSGGHFGAMEEPATIIEDIRSFFRPLRL